MVVIVLSLCFPRAKLCTAYRNWLRQVLRTATIPRQYGGGH